MSAQQEGAEGGEAKKEEDEGKAREAALEESLAGCVVRTQPLGFDRHFRRYWWFQGASPDAKLCRQSLPEVALCHTCGLYVAPDFAVASWVLPGYTMMVALALMSQMVLSTM